MIRDPRTPRLGRRVVVAVVPDLFFAARIRETARAAGVTLIQCPAGRALEVCSAEQPDLVIVDLHGLDDPLGMVRALKRDPATGALPVAGYYSHVDQEARRAAEAAGMDLVLPRSAFTARLAELLAGGVPPVEP
jgi:CheY-like chemotaxis protein